MPSEIKSSSSDDPTRRKNGDASPKVSDLEKKRQQAEERRSFIEASQRNLMALSQELKAKQEASSIELNSRITTIDTALRFARDTTQEQMDKWASLKSKTKTAAENSEKLLKEEIELHMKTAKEEMTAIQEDGNLDHREKMNKLNNTAELQKENMEQSHLQLLGALSQYQRATQTAYDDSVRVLKSREAEAKKHMPSVDQPLPSIEARLGLQVPGTKPKRASSEEIQRGTAYSSEIYDRKGAEEAEEAVFQLSDKKQNKWQEEHDKAAKKMVDLRESIRTSLYLQVKSHSLSDPNIRKIKEDFDNIVIECNKQGGYFEKLYKKAKGTSNELREKGQLRIDKILKNESIGHDEKKEKIKQIVVGYLKPIGECYAVERSAIDEYIKKFEAIQKRLEEQKRAAQKRAAQNAAKKAVKISIEAEQAFQDAEYTERRRSTANRAEAEMSAIEALNAAAIGAEMQRSELDQLSEARKVSKESSLIAAARAMRKPRE